MWPANGASCYLYAGKFWHLQWHPYIIRWPYKQHLYLAGHSTWFELWPCKWTLRQFTLTCCIVQRVQVEAFIAHTFGQFEHKHLVALVALAWHNVSMHHAFALCELIENVLKLGANEYCAGWNTCDNNVVCSITLKKLTYFDWCFNLSCLLMFL